MNDLLTCFDSEGVRFAVLFINESHPSGIGAKSHFNHVIKFAHSLKTFVVDVNTDAGLEVADVLNVSKTPQLRIYEGSTIIAQTQDPKQFESFLR